ncbi:UNVERIFIED_CONTAM: hypothetical protein FKN15_055647 [Acipenser sinensis]
MYVATATLVGSPGLSCDCCKTGDVNRDLDLVVIGDCSDSVSSSGQTTQISLNSSWSGIQSYATGLSTERSSVYSWRDDEFDRVNTQNVHQLFWDVDEMLFEGKVCSRTQGLQTECKEWTKRSPHLRILGSQLVLPRDDEFQHVQKRTSISKTIPSPSYLDSTSDMKELCLLGQKLVATLSPVHGAFGSSETCSDPSLYSFLEEEIYEVDGKIEEYFAYDTKEMLCLLGQKLVATLSPVHGAFGSSETCSDPSLYSFLEEEIYEVDGKIEEYFAYDTKEIMTKLVIDEDTQIVNLENTGGKLLPEPASHVTVDSFSIPPSRGSELRSTSFWSNFNPPQASRMASAFHSSLKGVMTIQAKPLQQRHAGLTEKTHCDQDEKHLSMGPSVLTSARNRLGRLQDHSNLSSSKMMQTASCKPLTQRKLPVLSSEALRFKTRNAYREEVLRGTKLNTGTDSVSSPSVHSTRKTQFPPINSETLENNLSVPCNLLCRRRYPHSRVSSATPESTGRQPLRERLIALDHFSRPNTTHTFRCRRRYPHSRVSSATPESTGRQPLRERLIALDHFSRPNTTHTFRVGMLLASFVCTKLRILVQSYVTSHAKNSVKNSRVKTLKPPRKRND